MSASKRPFVVLRRARACNKPVAVIRKRAELPRERAHSTKKSQMGDTEVGRARASSAHQVIRMELSLSIRQPGAREAPKAG